MVTRIEVSSTVFDTRAATRKKKFLDFPFGKKIESIAFIDVYSVEKKLTEQQLSKAASALTNPIIQKATIGIDHYSNPPPFSSPFPRGRLGGGHFTWAIEVGFLPGVTDNLATTAKEIIADLLKIRFSQDEGMYSSQVTFIKGDITEQQAWQLANSLYNPLIQRAIVKNSKEYSDSDFTVPKVTLEEEKMVIKVDLDIDDEALTKIGKLGIENGDGTQRGPLALDLRYMKTIQTHFKKFGRNPTDIELESIAQTWSEHCKHTIFRDPIDDIKEGIFKAYIKRATDEIRKVKGKDDFCVSVFTDNSGGIAFDKDFVITHKVETHNSPSALDPFGGAVTGIVGVNRDTLGFGLGAKPIANFYGYCFADPFTDTPLYKAPRKEQKMLSSRRIMNGVIDGVNNGGNCSGIPTPQGFVYFDERYRGKPLVFVGTIGLIPRKIKGKLSHVKKAKLGDYIVMIGGRVGKDGIHGATFSSEALASDSPATAVQIGDPITQKKFSDAIVKEARDKLLYNSITDNGAGGLSCSVSEMAKESGGCEVTLEKVPLKYPGLQPWEIWVSESQERMTLAIPKTKWQAFKAVMDRHDVEATVIGRFTNSGKCVVSYNNKSIMDVSLDFLHDGLPKRQLITKPLTNTYKEPKLPKPKNLTLVVKQMLTQLNIASTEFISQQYDHIVQGNAVLMPVQGRGRVNAEASAIRPVLSSDQGVVLSQGMFPTYGDISTYHMAQAAIDTALRNVVAAGADPKKIAILDNFCWCSANEPERLWQLKEAAKACYDLATYYGTPFISGKDSMFNDFHGFDENGKPISISIPPTILITSLGITNDITSLVSLDAKLPGDIVYLLGNTHNELGGSEYYAMLSKKEPFVGTNVPKVHAQKNRALYNAYFTCIQKQLIASAQSVGRGGLAVALAKTATGGHLGLDLSLEKLSRTVKRDDTALFSESQGRIVVTVAKEKQKQFEKIMRSHAVAQLGVVTDEQYIKINGLRGNPIVHLSIKDALMAYRSTFERF